MQPLAISHVNRIVWLSTYMFLMGRGGFLLAPPPHRSMVEIDSTIIERKKERNSVHKNLCFKPAVVTSTRTSLLMFQ